MKNKQMNRITQLLTQLFCKQKNTAALLIAVVMCASCGKNLIDETVVRITGVYEGTQVKTLVRRPAAPDSIISSQVVQVRVARDPDGRYHRTDSAANLYIDGEIAIFSLNNRTFTAPKPNGLGMGGAFFYNDSLSFYNRSQVGAERFVVTFRGRRKN
jgi:hypothetical protein